MTRYAVTDIEIVRGRVLIGTLLPRPDVDGQGVGPAIYQDWADKMSDEHWDLLADPDTVSVAHTSFDWVQLGRRDLDIKGDLHDTRVGFAILNEAQKLDLGTLAQKYVGITLDKKVRDRLDTLPEDEVLAYNRGDLFATDALYRALLLLLKKHGWTTYWEEEEVPFTRVLVDAMVRGMPVDTDAAATLKLELAQESERRLALLYTEAGLSPDQVNLRSGDQLAAYLFSKRFFVPGRLPITKEQRAYLKADGPPYDVPPYEVPPPGFTIEKVGRLYAHGTWVFTGRGLKKGMKSEKKNRPSTSTPALKMNLATAKDEWVQNLLRWRRIDKVISTYLEPWPAFTENGRLYGNFNQLGTVTGRLSSSEPNLQNVPAHGDLGPRMRSLFTGDLVVGDFSQLEPRLWAHFSKDARLLAVFESDNPDVYADMAERVYGRRFEKGSPERQNMKTYALALGYGAGAKKLAGTVTASGFPQTVAEAEDILRQLRKAYPTFFAWKDAVVAHAHVKGYVTTLAGRLRRLSANLNSFNWRNVGYGERQAVNAVIQGSAADVVRRCMIVIAREVPEVVQLAQIHDEVISEFVDGTWSGTTTRSDVVQRIRAAGEIGTGFKLNVPLVFEPHVVERWSDK